MLALWNENKLVVFFLVLAIIVWIIYIWDFAADFVDSARVYSRRRSEFNRRKVISSGFVLVFYVFAGAFVIWCVFWPHPY